MVADLAVVADLGHQLLLGDPNVESNTDDHEAGLADISAFQAVAGGGMVGQLVVYLSPGSTTDRLLVGLYDDTGVGHPRSLLTSGVIDNPVAGAWNTAGVPPAAVSGGATYWIAMVSPVGHGGFNFPYGTMSGPVTEHSQESNLAALPATWTSGDTFPGTFCSFYATPAREARISVRAGP